MTELVKDENAQTYLDEEKNMKKIINFALTRAIIVSFFVAIVIVINSFVPNFLPQAFAEELDVQSTIDVCGKEPVFYDSLPEHFYEECEQQGSVHTFKYAQKKEFSVWTPYNYAEDVQYNVLVLMHGTGGNHTSWISLTRKANGKEFKCSDIYDNIVAENKVQPFIVVSIPADSTVSQITRELRDVILPIVVENFSTWAEKAEDISNVREHFGIGGYSEGAMKTYHVGMKNCLDLFGNFMPLAGYGDQKEVVKALNNNEFKDLPINCFFAAVGCKDRCVDSFPKYKAIRDSDTERFVEGTNTWWQVTNGGHDWEAWSTGVYNALQVMF